MGSLTFRSLLESHATTRPDTTYLQDARSSRKFTYRTLLEIAKAWQQAAHGEAVTYLLDCRDPLVFGAVYCGLLYAGARVVPVDPASTLAEITTLLERIPGVKAILSDHLEQKSIATIPVERLTQTALPQGDLSQKQSSSQPEGTIIMFTSGSTGKPKGIELPASQLLYVAEAIARHNHLTPGDVGFNSLPLFHINAQVVGLLSTLIAGATLVLDEKFHRTGFWPLLAEHRVTWLNAVPAILAVLARSGDSIVPPPTLRFIRSASSPLPEPVAEAFASTPLIVSYGMTEGASQITAMPLDTPRRKGSVGVSVGHELEIRDSAGKALPVDTPGDIWLRGPGIITYYLGNEHADRFDTAGWLKTGDVGKVDGDGYVYLLSRTDDVINRGGEKLYPADIEEVLLGDKRVREAVVVAQPDDILGQVPVAYVIPAASEEGLREELVERCKKQLSSFKQPADIIVVDDLPRVSTGKIQRVKVREMAAQR